LDISEALVVIPGDGAKCPTEDETKGASNPDCDDFDHDKTISNSGVLFKSLLLIGAALTAITSAVTGIAIMLFLAVK
tara:strand:- start:1690 stop:1920 length:231 start_codon:yes stop_codon:yes gene_type:complete